MAAESNKDNMKIDIPEQETANTPGVEALLEILIDLNMSQSQQTVSLLMNYMNDMEENFFSVLQELDTVKEQLANIHKTPQTQEVCQTLSQLTGQTGDKIASLQGQLKEVRVSLNEKAARLVQNFKDHGIKALNHVCEFLGIKETMTQLKESLLDNAVNMQASMDKIDNVANELREASTHAKNVGRVMAGKETLAVPGSREKGFFHQIKRPYQSMKSFCMKQATKLEKGIESMERLEKSAGRATQKPSITAKLQNFKEQQDAQKKAAPAMHQEKKQENTR